MIIKPIHRHTPFDIPHVREGVVTTDIAHILAMDKERVRGFISNGLDPDPIPFDVSHDGTVFYVGEDSGRVAFYFSNWNKKVDQAAK